MKKRFDTKGKRIIWTCIVVAMTIAVFFCISCCSSNTTAAVQATSTASVSPSAKATSKATASASLSATSSASPLVSAEATEQTTDTKEYDQTASAEEPQPSQQESSQQVPVQQEQVQQDTPAPQQTPDVTVAPEATPTPCVPTTTQEKVKDAWDETVIDVPAYDKQVCNVCGAEFTGSDQVEKVGSHIAAVHDAEGGYHDVYVPAVTHTVHHDAEYKEVTSGC
jgi:K+-sensing histidine kinase KdpD